MTNPDSALARKLRAYVGLTPEEISALGAENGRRQRIDAGRDLIHEGQSGHTAYVLARGWVCSYKLLRGGSRQIIDVQVPGDFLGLRSLLLRTSDHSFEAITEIEVSEITAAGLFSAFALNPRLATAVLWAASRDEAMVVEHLVDVGRRSALERTAHFLLELGARLRLVGLASSAGYDCPLSQYLLADALGLSAIHLNRILRQLREKGMLTFRKGTVTFDDLESLIDLAEFDETYLDQISPFF
jgi:CRP-like cAMP-binding protein